MGCCDSVQLSRPPRDAYEREMLNHCLSHRTSYLCATILEEEHLLAVHQSGAGFYLGVVDPQTGEPLSRDSQEYYPNPESAQIALINRTWTQRLDP